MEEGSCQQLPGSGISGTIQGRSVSVGSQEYVCGGLERREKAAAGRFMEASTSQTAGSMQVLPSSASVEVCTPSVATASDPQN